MNKLKAITITAGIATLVSCGAGFSDITYEITNGYFLESSSPENKSIYYKGNDAIPRETLIDPSVVSFAYNSRYIAVLRQPIWVEFQKDSITSGLEEDCEYWLIDMQSNKLEGPMNKVDYMKVQTQTGILMQKLSKPISTGVSRYCIERNQVAGIKLQ